MLTCLTAVESIQLKLAPEQLLLYIASNVEESHLIDLLCNESYFERELI